MGMSHLHAVNLVWPWFVNGVSRRRLRFYDMLLAAWGTLKSPVDLTVTIASFDGVILQTNSVS